MKFPALKVTRVVLALLFFLPLLFLFCDFAGILPKQWHILAQLQFIPAVSSGSILFAGIIVLLTLLFGRIYCSVICPLGVLQDIIAWFSRRGKKKNRKKRWYQYHKPYNIVRYGLLAIAIIFLILGNITLLLYLDPYSNFGRIGANIFRPIVVEGNNLLNGIALHFNNYNFYHVTLHTITTASFIVALVALLLVGLLALLRGRLFCNSICPVGSFLGLLSRFSLFRITIDSVACTKCGVCARSCKAECIDSKNEKIDASRCVACFNCLDRCSGKALAYKLVFARKVQEKPAVNKNRRAFMATSAIIAATFPVLPAWAKNDEPVDFTKLKPITPPGSKNLKHFTEKCTACHLCVTHCPQQILKPAGFNFGFNYAFKPHLVFYEMAFCNYQCTVCSEICPNGAIEKLTKEEKKVTQIGIAQFERSRCIVYTENTSCGACSEHCPVQAVKMEAYKDGLTIPHVYEYLCIGCGGCESICPVRPVKAINILANTVHQTAERPPEEQQEEINEEQLDFGF